MTTLQTVLEKIAANYPSVDLATATWYNLSFDLFVSEDGDVFMDNEALTIPIPRQPFKPVRTEHST